MRIDGKRFIDRHGVRVERGSRVGGLDEQHPDPVLPYFVVQRLGISLEGVLARCVQGPEGRWDQAEDGAHVDDPAAAALPHVRQYSADHSHRTEEIGFEQRASLLQGTLLRSASDAEAGVVDQHIDAAGPVEHLAHRAGHRLIVGDVERQEHHLVPFLPRNRLTARPVHGETGVEQLMRGRLTDPGRCSRHQGHPSCLDRHDHSLVRHCITSIILQHDRNTVTTDTR